jgi:hypothetical protein
LTVASPKLSLPPAAVDVVVEHNASINLAAKNGTIATLLTTVTEAGGNELVALRLSEPVTLAWGGNGKEAVAAAPAKINLDIRKFNLQMASPFLPASAPVKLKSGEINASLVATIADLGKTVRSRTCHRWRHALLNDKAVEDVAFTEDIDVTLGEFRNLKVIRQLFVLQHHGATALQAQSTATLDLQALTGEIEASVPVCNQLLLALAPVPADVTKLIQRFDLNAKVNVKKSDKGRTIAVSGTSGIRRSMPVCLTARHFRPCRRRCSMMPWSISNARPPRSAACRPRFSKARVPWPA